MEEKAVAAPRSPSAFTASTRPHKTTLGKATMVWTRRAVVEHVSIALVLACAVGQVGYFRPRDGAASVSTAGGGGKERSHAKSSSASSGPRPVLELDALSFDAHVSNGSDWLVMFSAPWCGASKKAGGAFEAVAAGNYSEFAAQRKGLSFMDDIIAGPTKARAAADAGARLEAGDVRFAKVYSELSWKHWYNFPLSGARFGILARQSLFDRPLFDRFRDRSCTSRHRAAKHRSFVSHPRVCDRCVFLPPAILSLFSPLQHMCCY